jgi:hypothetical protein
MIQNDRPKFKLETTQAKITSHAGLVLVEKMAETLGVTRSLDRFLGHLKQRQRGHLVSQKVMDLVRLSVAGGTAVSDLGQLRFDRVLAESLGRKALMASSTAAEFLAQLGACEIEKLSGILGKITSDTLRLNHNEVATLDVDATFIEAHKQKAKFSFHKEPGYYPMLGFVAETQQLLLTEFRDGNASPSSGALEFLKQLVGRLPEAIEKIRLRSDSAWFNSKVMDYCEDGGIEFAITAEKNINMLQTIEAIAEEKWEVFGDDPDEKIAESVYSFNKGRHAYRIIVLRRPMRQLEMFGGIWEYRVVITNMLWDKRRLIMWHRERANSENFIKELKSGYSLEHLPSGEFLANSAWAQIISLAYNLVLALKILNLPPEYRPLTIKSLRFRLIHIAGVWIKHARQYILKLSAPAEIIALFRNVLHPSLRPCRI